MSKIFTIIFGVASFLEMFIEPDRQVAYLIGGAIVGILIGIFFDWIWTKTKIKSVKIIFVILFIILVLGKLGNILSFVNNSILKNKYAESFKSKPDKASSLVRTIFFRLEPSFKEAKKINFRQELDKVEEQLNKEDATVLTYFEELEKLNDLHQKIGEWVNDFDKKDIERFYNLFDNIFLTLKTACKNSQETIEQICLMELGNNYVRELAYSKEQLEIFKKIFELGVKKFITSEMSKYSTPEGKEQFKRALSKNNTINSLQKMVDTKLFVPIAEELIQEIAQLLQFADKTEIDFDLKKYMKTRFIILKDSPEGQKEIINDIKKLKDQVSDLSQAALMEVCFN